jgi:hypothetical protein
VDADYTRKLSAASCKLEYGHSTEAVTYRGQATVYARVRCQEVDSRLRPPAEPQRIITQFDNTGHNTLTIPGNTIPVHVACKHHVTEICQTLCAPFGVLVETGASVDDQDARTLPARGFIPS